MLKYQHEPYKEVEIKLGNKFSEKECTSNIEKNRYKNAFPAKSDESLNSHIKHAETPLVQSTVSKLRGVENLRIVIDVTFARA